MVSLSLSLHAPSLNLLCICSYCSPSSRSRKIRCDSTRPVCYNCVRRSNVCEYDTVPKRRGPDKRPGTRQRSCKKKPPPSDAALAHQSSASTGKRKRNIAADAIIPPAVKDKESIAANTRKRQRTQQQQADQTSMSAGSSSPVDLRGNVLDESRVSIIVLLHLCSVALNIAY